MGEGSWNYRRREDFPAIYLLSVKAEENASKLEYLEDESHKTEEDMKVLPRYSHIEELTQDMVDALYQIDPESVII